MEYETNQPQASVWQRLKDSPRTVSALIIILVIAAAMYAFSGSSPADAPEVANPTPTPESEPETSATSVKNLPPAEETNEGYVETAEPGDGATHLARRAVTRYLAEHSPSYELRSEHRIYIEDYIQKKMGSPRLEVGDPHTMTFALIQEAVEAAGKLSPTQLKNLSKYTSALK